MATQTVRRTETVKTSIKGIGEEIDKAMKSLRVRQRDADSVKERLRLRFKIRRLRKIRTDAYRLCKRVWTI